MTEHEHELTRRRLLAAGLAVPPVAVLLRYADLFDAEEADAALPLAATPAIADDDEPTPELTEGPYFTPNSPLRKTIIAPASAGGARLLLTGRVLTTAGKPISHALVDFWQANAAGAYDNAGYKFRGHQFTDAKGRYSVLTVVPGLYPGRTKHIHVKVQPPRKSILTTQLFFPGVSRNASDGIYTPETQVKRWRASGGRRLATFDFVLDV